MASNLWPSTTKCGLWKLSPFREQTDSRSALICLCVIQPFIWKKSLFKVSFMLIHFIAAHAAVVCSNKYLCFQQKLILQWKTLSGKILSNQCVRTLCKLTACQSHDEQYKVSASQSTKVFKRCCLGRKHCWLWGNYFPIIRGFPSFFFFLKKRKKENKILLCFVYGDFSLFWRRADCVWAYENKATMSPLGLCNFVRHRAGPWYILRAFRSGKKQAPHLFFVYVQNPWSDEKVLQVGVGCNLEERKNIHTNKIHLFNTGKKAVYFFCQKRKKITTSVYNLHNGEKKAHDWRQNA